MPELLRVFLDANILFSASYEPDHPFQRFWRESNVICLTSFYAAGEARRNALREDQPERLETLLEMTHLVSDATHFPLPSHFAIPSKDQPILAAALQCGADYLITGDRAHFGEWMNQPIAGPVGDLIILLPKPFLEFLKQQR